jgi:hypothetical protein
MLSEPPKDDIPAVCSEVLAGGLSLLNSAGQEVIRVVSPRVALAATQTSRVLLIAIQLLWVVVTPGF